ncbi:hypothetical protein [Cetobacterium sp.]|uniref:hypothetical protein n=1 Tax=Cetobacterium sp. TaxID=2071632 RepID=UPI003F3AC2EC
MKKLLLVSLLAMSATSFAAVVGSNEYVEMPVKVRGEVVETTDELVITPLKNAGVDGTSMEFDFGKLTQGGTQLLEGTFEVKRANGTRVVADNVTIGMLQADNTAIADSIQSVITSGAGVEAAGVTVDYRVSTNAHSDGNSYKGVLAVNATVADDAEFGNFLDTTRKVAVRVAP